MDARACVGVSAVRWIVSARGLSASVAFAGRTALAYGVYERTGSAFWVSAVLIATVGAAGLIAPLGGWLGDRCRRRRVMIWSELCAAGLFVALSFAVDIRLVVALALAAAAAQVPFVPSASAAVSNLVAGEQLCWANGLMAGAMNLGVIVGPAAAGVLLGVGGTALVFRVGAILSLLSAGAVWLTAEAGAGRPCSHRVRGVGFGVILEDTKLTAVVSAGALTFVAFGIVIVADPPLASRFGAGAVGYALLTAVYGLGAMFGGLVASRLLRASSERRALVAGTGVLAASIASIAALPSFPGIVVVGGIGGLGHGISAAGWSGLLQRATADDVRARVLGASQAVEQSAAALAMVLGAALVDVLGAQSVYVVPGVILAMAAGMAALAAGWSLGRSGRRDLIT